MNPVFVLGCSFGLGAAPRSWPPLGKRTDLIYTDAHGYDAELGYIVATAVDEANPAVYECPKCGRQPLDVFARFKYPDDVFDGDFTEFAGHEEDVVTWVSLVGKCCRCPQLLAVTDFECA